MKWHFKQFFSENNFGRNNYTEHAVVILTITQVVGHLVMDIGNQYIINEIFSNLTMKM